MTEKAKEEPQHPEHPAAEKPKGEARYRVLQDVSVRKRPDADEWVTYEAGERHQESVFPPHMDLKGLVRSGHLEREEE